MKKTLNLAYGSYADLFDPAKLLQLDKKFLSQLEQSEPELYPSFCDYRLGKKLPPQTLSELLIVCAKQLELFIADLFAMGDELLQLKEKIATYDPLFFFQKWFVARRAKRRLSSKEILPSFASLTSWLRSELAEIGADAPPPLACHDISELNVARYGEKLLKDKEKNKQKIEKLTQWCIQVLKSEQGKFIKEHWISFKLAKTKDYQNLIDLVTVANDNLDGSEKKQTTKPLKQRQGFKLTDHRMSMTEVLHEIHYCVYCHKNDGDFCSKGFPQKKGIPESKLRTNPVGTILTGCPLDEKISEMHLLKGQGYTIAALAMIMIDNPMCPATGHRICNDCMKACIYQKQDPVNIPEIETRILTDVLALPFGVEIYGLLTRWLPLRQKQWSIKPFNGLKILVAGMGPAGFSVAHHLLMEGFAVVGIDGMKIEPLPPEWLNQPIEKFQDICQPLDQRKVNGFGGVAEYGITVRWDKNFLTLIYLTLMRHRYFQLFGGIRFGGTLTVDDVWQLGFDHLTIALGAGLPKALPILGSLATGMRQANDFLMSLQLTTPYQKNSLASLQLRLPIIIIGGGLTAVDTATEAQAYYLKQVEQILNRYEDIYGIINDKDDICDSHLSACCENLNIAAKDILYEFLTHGLAIRHARQLHTPSGQKANLTKLIHQWGGVTIVYRRHIQESPAYLHNHEELDQALKEGIFYQQGLQPKHALVDINGHIKAICFTKLLPDNDHIWYKKHGFEETITLKTHSVLVATGTQLNIAYAFEHPNTFKRDGMQYQTYDLQDNQLIATKKAQHIKQKQPIGIFTSYHNQGRYVTFIGDSHPTFHGSVVKAIASANYAYPKITQALTKRLANISQTPQQKEENYQPFAKQLQQQLTCEVIARQQLNDQMVELIILAPQAAKKHQPGQFYRLQALSSEAVKINEQSYIGDPLPLLAFNVDKEKGQLSFIINQQSSLYPTSTKLHQYLQPGQAIHLMGPTGVRTKIPDNQANIFILGQQNSIPYLLAVAKALKQKGNHIMYLGCFDKSSNLYHQQLIEAYCDICIWSVMEGKLIKTNRPQDFTTTGNGVEALLAFAKENPKHQDLLKQINRMTLIGNPKLLQTFQQGRCQKLKNYFDKSTKIFATSYAPMQCMLKGICAQCLQWQINPETGLRHKAIFTCSWQDQPIELIDIDNLIERQRLNKVNQAVNWHYLTKITNSTL